MKVRLEFSAITYPILLVMALPVIFVNALVYGLVLPIMWKLSVVPIFHIQEISFLQGASLGILTSYIFGKHIDCEPEKDRTKANIKLWAFTVIRPVALIITLWIISKFM